MQRLRSIDDIFGIDDKVVGAVHRRRIKNLVVMIRPFRVVSLFREAMFHRLKSMVLPDI